MPLLKKGVCPWHDYIKIRWHLQEIVPSYMERQQHGVLCEGWNGDATPEECYGVTSWWSQRVKHGS